MDVLGETTHGAIMRDNVTAGLFYDHPQSRLARGFAVIRGVRVKLQVVHIKPCYGRAFIIRAYLLQTHEMSWCDAAKLARRAPLSDAIAHLDSFDRQRHQPVPPLRQPFEY